MALGRFGYPEFVVGVLQILPYPKLKTDESRLGQLALTAHSLRRTLFVGSETDHAFLLPDLLQVQGSDVAGLTEAIKLRMADTQKRIDSVQMEIDASLFGFTS